MWREKPEDIHHYFSEIQSKGQVPEEEILGETYSVLPQKMWQKWLDEWELDGEDIKGLDTDGQNGSAYFQAIEGDSLIVVDHERPEKEVRATAIHEETHIATGNPADRFNIEGIAYARENFYRQQVGLENFQLDYYPLLNRVIDQWTESYIPAANEIGDEKALRAASETLNQYEPSFLEQLKTPFKNPYVEVFEEKARNP